MRKTISLDAKEAGLACHALNLAEVSSEAALSLYTKLLEFVVDCQTEGIRKLNEEAWEAAHRPRTWDYQ